MCNVCAALYAMREGLEYECDGKTYHILAVGKTAEGPGKFQIRTENGIWRDKWIRTKDIAFMMADIGADIKLSVRTDIMKKRFIKYLEKLNLE
jgi:hypothetical protein